MRHVTGREFERLGCAHSSGLWGQRKSANGFQSLTGHHRRQYREVSLESTQPFESLKGIPVSQTLGLAMDLALTSSPTSPGFCHVDLGVCAC